MDKSGICMQKIIPINIIDVWWSQFKSNTSDYSLTTDSGVQECHPISFYEGFLKFQKVIWPSS